MGMICMSSGTGVRTKRIRIMRKVQVMVMISCCLITMIVIVAAAEPNAVIRQIVMIIDSKAIRGSNGIQEALPRDFSS